MPEIGIEEQKLMDPITRLSVALRSLQLNNMSFAFNMISGVERLYEGFFLNSHAKPHSKKSRKTDRLNAFNLDDSVRIYSSPLKSPGNETSEVLQGIKQYVFPFRAFVPDTSGRTHHIEITITLSKIDSLNNEVIIRLKVFNLKTQEWLVKEVPTSVEHLNKHRKSFFKYWFLIQEAFNQHVDKSLQTNVGETRFIIDSESLVYYKAGQVGIVKEIMCLVFDYMTMNFHLNHGMIGQNIRLLSKNTQALHMLKLYFYRKNQIFIRMVQNLKTMTYFDENATQNMYDFIKFRTEDLSLASPNWSPRKRGQARKIKIIPRQINTQNIDTSIEGHSLFYLENNFGQKSGGNSEVESYTEWNDIVSESSVILPAGKVIDSIRPLVIKIIKYEMDFYIMELKIESVLNLVRTEEPKRKSRKGFKIDDFYVKFTISVRGREIIDTQNISLKDISSFLKIPLDDMLNFIIKRVSRSIIPRNLKLKMDHAIIEKASKN